jgi:hypothetical protein
MPGLSALIGLIGFIVLNNAERCTSKLSVLKRLQIFNKRVIFISSYKRPPLRPVRGIIGKKIPIPEKARAKKYKNLKVRLMDYINTFHCC